VTGATYRDRRTPGPVLVKWDVCQTFGTLEDTTQRNHLYRYVVDVDGFGFRRYVRADNAPTRWEKMISPSRPMGTDYALGVADRLLASSTRLMTKGTSPRIIEDTRARYGHPAQ
jgi:hypothetical protein